jgi:hypothetical protein
LQKSASPFEAFEAFLAFRAFIAQHLQSWVFMAVGDKPCEECDSYDGEVFEVESEDELFDIFEYGELVDAETFKPNVHPNCFCFMKKISEVELAPPDVPFAEFWQNIVEKGV